MQNNGNHGLNGDVAWAHEQSTYTVLHDHAMQALASTALRDNARRQAVGGWQGHLESDEDVSHLFLGEAVAQGLEAGGHCRLPTQLACTTQQAGLCLLAWSVTGC